MPPKLSARARVFATGQGRKTAQLHQLLLELISGGAKRDLSAAQAKVLLARVRPRDVVGKTLRRVAAELVADLERIYARKKAANKKLTGLLKATGTSLLNLHDVGPTRTALLLDREGCQISSSGSRRERTLTTVVLRGSRAR